MAVPLKYLKNSWRSLEVLLINCKVELSLTWNPNYVLTSLDGDLNFTITDAKLYVSILTLSVEDNAKLSKLLSGGFKGPVYCNKYRVNPNKTYSQNHYHYIRKLINASYQGVKRLFVLAYDNTVTADSHRRYFLPRGKIENYSIEIHGRNAYDQPVNDLIKQCNEVRKVSTGQGDDLATVAYFAYFEKQMQVSCG